MPVSARAGCSILRASTPYMVVCVSTCSRVMSTSRTHMDASVTWRARVVILWGGEKWGAAVVEQLVSEQL
jgi:hypothetical protein